MNIDEIKIGRAENLIGQKFGKLTVLYRTKNIGKHTAWKCKCECGNETVVRVDHLKEKRIVSCGCYNKELASAHIKNLNKKWKNAKDITGMRSGWLIALKPTEKRIHYGNNNSKVVWKCQCLNPIHNEPKYCEATTSDITMKNKTSCGCVNSRGEAKIADLLSKNNVYFETQKTFNSCRFITTNSLAKFDFYVDNKYIIEFDGKQHFEELNNNWEQLKNIKERDAFKTEWCKENNIPLIRIPYWKLETLNINDLLLERSEYLKNGK